MPTPANVEYTVVLVFPGFGEELDNAREVLEEALDYLHAHKDQPGMRFAYPVTARLEHVPDIEEAEARLRTDDTVALMILHGLEDEERLDFTRECARREVAVCYTLPGADRPRPPGPRGPWKVVIKKRAPDDEPSAHRVSEATLTAPLDGDPEELQDRVGQLIAVMALGVMGHHWVKNPPRTFPPGT